MHAYLVDIRMPLSCVGHFGFEFVGYIEYALMYVQFVHLALGSEDAGVQLVYENTCCLAWGVILTVGKIGALPVSSLF